MRLIIFLLCLSMSIGSFSVHVHASSPIEKKRTCRDLILRGLEQCQDEIRLDDTGILVQDALDIYAEIRLSEPQLFHVSNRIGYLYTPDGYVTSLYPSYTMTDLELDHAREEYIIYVQTFLTAHDKQWMLSSWEKALYIHDYLAKQYTQFY